MADGQQFIDVIREDDVLLIDAEQLLLDLIEAVQRTGKPGRLTLTLDVKRPKKAADALAIWVSANVTTKVPRPDTEDHLFFAQGRALSRRDPRQPAMPGMRRVDRDTGVIEDDGDIEDEGKEAVGGR